MKFHWELGLLNLRLAKCDSQTCTPNTLHITSREALSRQRRTAFVQVRREKSWTHGITDAAINGPEAKITIFIMVIIVSC